MSLVYIMTPELIANTRKAYREGNAWAGYSKWRLDADPTWFERRNILTCYHAWIATEDKYFLDLALEPQLMVPSTFSNDRNLIRQECAYWVIMYDLLQDQMTEELKNEWKLRLNNMMLEMLRYCRVGDWDECLSYLGGWMIYDKVFGTKYMETTDENLVGENTPIEVYEYVKNNFSAEWIKGGFVDASTEYYINNASIHCLQAAALGIDAFPWFKTWILELGKYLLWSVSHDLGWAESHGDRQGTYEEILNSYYRPGLMWMVHTLGGDPTGELLSFSMKITSKEPISNPYHLYPYGTQWAALVVDPYVMAGHDTTKTIPTGTFVSEGSGVIINRTPETYMTLNYLNHFFDDHAYMGSTVDILWRFRKTDILVRPGGYGIGGNEVQHHNGVAFKNDGWLWPRKFLGATTNNPIKVYGEMWGPSPRFYHDINKQSEANAYDRCKLQTQLTYDEVNRFVEFRHVWNSPGSTFPEWTNDAPVVQQYIHSRYPIEFVDGYYSWNIPNIGKVILSSNAKKVIFTEQNHRDKWYVAQFQSEANEYNSDMYVKVQLILEGETIPNPEPEPEEPEPEPILPGILLTDLIKNIRVTNDEEKISVHFYKPK